MVADAEKDEEEEITEEVLLFNHVSGFSICDCVLFLYALANSANGDCYL